MRERRLHFSTVLLPVKNLLSPLIEKSGWTTKAGWTFGEDKNLAHAHKPNLSSSAIHPVAKSSY
jgi:hypothetical protein